MHALLLCDLGNTSMKLGIADEKGLRTSFSLPSPGGETSDSLGFRLLEILRHAGVARDELAAVVACSVVPQADSLLRGAAARFLDCPCLFVQKDLPVPLENRYSRPGEVGADRLVGAFAARRLFPDAPSFVIADYGTAATFDCVEGDAYLGGLIFPGPQTAARALAANTARLPSVDLEMEDAQIAPCLDTATSITHGLVFGFVCVTEGLVSRLAQGLRGPAKKLATGGFAWNIARLSPVFDEVLPTLLLDGLRLLYLERP